MDWEINKTRVNREVKIMNKSFFVKLLIVVMVILAAGIILFLSPLRDLFWGKVIANKQGTIDNGSGYEEKDSLKNRVEEVVNSLSQEQMAGQLLMVGFNGKETGLLSEPDDKPEICRRGLFFWTDIESREQVTKLTVSAGNGVG